MKTLTLELPNQAALKLEELEQKHGERLRHVLGKLVLSALEKIEKSPEAELHSLETMLAATQQNGAPAVDFQTAANYVIDTNIELYKRLA